MGKDPSEIRREIEETRMRMGDTVEALGYKANVPERVKDAVNDRVETVRGTLGDVVDSVRATVSGAGERVGNALGDARSRVNEQVGSARENAGTLRARIPSVNVPAMSGDTMRTVARRVGMATENPLGLALGGLAIGLLAGLLVPVTDYEREKVGPLRDDLLDRAQTIGGDVVAHGKAVLQDATQTAIDTAQQRARDHAGQVLEGGLDPQSLASNVMEHGKAVLTETAQAVAQSAQQSAQEHGKQVIAEATGKSSHETGASSRDTAMAAGMPSDASQGGGLRGGVDMSGGTGAQTTRDTGRTSAQYGSLLDEEGREPGSPGTASP